MVLHQNLTEKAIPVLAVSGILVRYKAHIPPEALPVKSLSHFSRSLASAKPRYIVPVEKDSRGTNKPIN